MFDMTFSKVLLKNIILSDFDCFSLLKDAADAGQIALVEKIMDMEEKASHLDRVDTRFSIMVQCAKNGRFDAYEYFLNQCTAEQLNKNPSWSQNVLSAIAFDNIEFLNYLFNHPSFDLSQTTIELSYAETKDDEKMKTCLRAMAPEEQLIQKSLFSNNDSPEAFNILRTLLTRYVNAFDLEAFNNFKSDQFDMNKKIFLFKRSGVIKKYLSFQESFFTSANNIRKFFYCYNFTNDDLQNQILRIIFRIYDLDYTASEKAVE